MSLTIAVAGPPGAGSTTTALLLAKKLSINFFSIGQLFKDISSGKFRSKFYAPQFLKICEEKNLLIPEFESPNDSRGAINLWQTDFGKSPELHKAIDKLQIKLAEKGNLVIDGKLSLYIIRNAKPKIWLKADLDERARRAANRDLVSKTEAKEIVEKRQSFEREEWKKIYKVDSWEQEGWADIVIDTTYLTPEQVVEKILRYPIFSDGKV